MFIVDSSMNVFAAQSLPWQRPIVDVFGPFAEGPACTKGRPPLAERPMVQPPREVGQEARRLLNRISGIGCLAEQTLVAYNAFDPALGPNLLDARLGPRVRRVGVLMDEVPLPC